MDGTSLVKLAKSLSDPHCLCIVQEIARAQRLACANLYAFVPIRQPSMSQHVKVLVESGLVDSQKKAAMYTYQLIQPSCKSYMSFYTCATSANYPESVPSSNHTTACAKAPKWH